MSTYDLEEQEQLAALKAWWKEHGGAVALGAMLVAAAVGAWNGWLWYQRSQSVQAAALYDVLQKAARANDLKATREAAGSILEDFPRSAYAPLAARIRASAESGAGDQERARAVAVGGRPCQGRRGTSDRRAAAHERAPRRQGARRGA